MKKAGRSARREPNRLITQLPFSKHQPPLSFFPGAFCWGCSLSPLPPLPFFSFSFTSPLSTHFCSSLHSPPPPLPLPFTFYDSYTLTHSQCHCSASLKDPHACCATSAQPLRSPAPLSCPASSSLPPHPPSTPQQTACKLLLSPRPSSLLPSVTNHHPLQSWSKYRICVQVNKCVTDNISCLNRVAGIQGDGSRDYRQHPPNLHGYAGDFAHRPPCPRRHAALYD